MNIAAVTAFFLVFITYFIHNKIKTTYLCITMNPLNYRISPDDCSLQKCMLWGVSTAHFNKIAPAFKNAAYGTVCKHLLMGIFEAVPVIGQFLALTERHFILIENEKIISKISQPILGKSLPSIAKEPPPHSLWPNTPIPQKFIEPTPFGQTAQQDPSVLQVPTPRTISIVDTTTQETGLKKIPNLLSSKERIAVLQLRQSLTKTPSNATKIIEIYDLAASAAEKSSDWMKALQIRRLACQEKGLFLDTHPLQNMNEAIATQSKKMTNPIYGAHFSRLGAGSLRGGNIRLCRRQIQDRGDAPPTLTTCLDFRISRNARDRLQSRMEKFIEQPNVLKELGVTIKETPYFFRKYDEVGKIYTKSDGYTPKKNDKNLTAYEVVFKDIGIIRFAKDPECLTLYDHIVVETTQKIPSAEDMQKMLTLIGLGPILTPTTPEAEDKLKKMCLLRAFAPIEAYQISKQPDYESLNEALLKTFDNTQTIEQRLSKMKLKEIFPGKEVWTIPSISGTVKAQGHAYGLVTGITSCDMLPTDQQCKIISQILKEGPVSLLERSYAGIFVSGCSPDADLYSGGGNQVYTRLVTQNIHKKMNIPGSRVRLLYSLQALDGISYGYITDTYGSKHEKDYASAARENLENLSVKINTEKEDTLSNELMIKERIDPRFIQGIQILDNGETEIIFQEWVNLFKSFELVQEDPTTKQLTILGKPITKFIQVETTLRNNLFPPEFWEENVVE